jgi:hypothetical protein
MRVLIVCSDASVRDAFLDALQQADIGVIPAVDAAATLSWRGSSAPTSCCLTTSCRGSVASKACVSWPPKARIRSSWSSPDGSIREAACARSSRTPPGTSAGESRPRRSRASFAVPDAPTSRAWPFRTTTLSAPTRFTTGSPSFPRSTWPRSTLTSAGARIAPRSPAGSTPYDEPWPGYDELGLDEVRAVLSEGDEQRVGDVRAYERKHKARAGVIQATERELSNA